MVYFFWPHWLTKCIQATASHFLSFFLSLHSNLYFSLFTIPNGFFFFCYSLRTRLRCNIFVLPTFIFSGNVWESIRKTEQVQHSGTIFWRLLSRLEVKTINIISCSSSLITFEWKSGCLNEQPFRLSCLALLKLPMNASLALLSSSHTSFHFCIVPFFSSIHLIYFHAQIDVNKTNLD